MEDLEDELDLRYHRGLKPDVYYRCPTLESLGGALRNELEKNASSLIPVETVTEFVFATASTITIPAAQQSALDALIQPAEHLQSITAEYALCRDIDGQERLKIQRAVARSIIEAIQEVDGFKYSQRSVKSKEGGDGARLRYICQDSLQNRDRKSNMKKEKEHASEDSEAPPKKRNPAQLPTYDCGGAIHVKFSLKREAINVVYKHNPIHGSPKNRQNILPPLPLESTTNASVSKLVNGNKKQKRKQKQKDQVDVENDYGGSDLNVSTSPGAPKASAKKKQKKNTTIGSMETNCKTATKKAEKVSELLPPSTLSGTAQAMEPSLLPRLGKGKACIRCREKKIKCDEGKPTCNRCQRGIWACQYEQVIDAKKRSKTGCINCKNRKRKCTEERPSCAHCLRADDDCTYAGYS